MCKTLNSSVSQKLRFPFFLNKLLLNNKMKQRKYNNNNKNERMRAASRLRTREEQSKKTNGKGKSFERLNREKRSK